MRTPKPYTATDGAVSYRVRFRDLARQSSETFDTQTQALRFAALLEHMPPADAIRQMDVEAGRTHVPTLDALALDHIRLLTDVTDGTRLNYTRLWARSWSPLVGTLPANHVTRDRLAEATLVLAKRYSGKSLKNQRGLLAAVLDRAVEHGHLATNPTKKLRLPRGREQDVVDMRILTEAELMALVEAMHAHYRPLLQFLASTGCRWGEAVALQVGDVALTGDRPTVRVKRSLQWSPDNDRQVGPTKTRRSNRALPLPAGMVDVLATITDGRDHSDLVFTAPRGGKVEHRTFWSDIWLPALEKAGTPPPRPRIHDLRHSYAARLLGAGKPIHVVQALLGHESIKTTVDTYGGLMPDALSAAVDAANMMFSWPTPPELEA